MRKKKLLFFLILILFFSITALSQSCGDGTCDPGENSCTCADDCGKCEGPAVGQTCKELYCSETNQCSIRIIENCCGNAICEGEENYGTCPGDCIPKIIEIEILAPQDEKFVRGEEVLLKVRITADGRAISSPTITATGFFDDFKFFNDGKHDDNLVVDNVFANTFFIPSDLEPGTQTITVEAEFLGVSSTSEVEIEIDPTLEIIPNVEPEIELGKNFDISGKILKKEVALLVNFEIKLFIDQELVLEESGKTDKNGFFKKVYRSSLLDRIGNWRLTISAKDGFGNSGFFERTISAKKPPKIEPLNIELTKNLEKNYSQGENIDIVLKLVNDKQELVKDAKVIVNLPNKEQLNLIEIAPGTYALSIWISREFKNGFNALEIDAQGIVNNTQTKATQQLIIDIMGFDLKIEIIEPSNLNYEVGEEMKLVIKVTDFEEEPVNDATVKALVNDQEILFELTKIGTYSAIYEIKPEDEGKIKIEFSAIDNFENSSLKSIEVGAGGKSFFYDISQNILIFGAVLVGFLLVGTGALVVIRMFRTEKSLEKKIKDLDDLQKQTQEKYFHKHLMSKKEYEETMEKYENSLKKAKNELYEMKKKK